MKECKAYVESENLDLNDSLLGCDNHGEPVNEHLTIHGYTNSSAHSYAERKSKLLEILRSER